MPSATACSAPQARPVQEQVEEPMASAAPTITKPTPRVITVDKNAASPKAIVELKAAGVLSPRVELRQVTFIARLFGVAA